MLLCNLAQVSKYSQEGDHHEMKFSPCFYLTTDVGVRDVLEQAIVNAK